ncbi:MAG: biotin--[acetyl-CoA-carboxylase] ligase [Actinomycetota bacterium]
MQQEPFDPSDFEALSRSVAWISRVYAYLSITSTNDEAVRRARSGEPEGTVVVADQQTAGRGRLGRRWLAEPGTALLASWIVRPPRHPDGGSSDGRPLLALATGVAAAAAIQAETGVEIALKWPNDLLVRERKIAGILAEALPDGSAVVGLGLNVRQAELPAEIKDVATSLLLERSKPIGRPRLLGSILQSFAPFAHAPGAALPEFRSRCSTLGREVVVERDGVECIGKATGVDDDGALIVVTDEGQLRVFAGDVVHLRARA